MSVPAYPEYKDSGVPWLGMVPGHWELERFKNLLRERDARSQDGSEVLLSVSAYTGVTPKSESTGEGEFLSRAESLEGHKICKKNDLVMNIMLAWNRGLGVTQYDGIVSPAYCVFELGRSLHPRFCDYAVRANEYTGYFKSHSAGVIDSRLRLYPDKFGALLCVVPSATEQAAIAAFLDRETAKIDALVTEEQRLITLLKEKRQAVISHAVTKGITPSAPMKHSGIEWLGEIPAHWEVSKVKFATSHVVDCLHTTPTYDGELEYPAIRTADVHRGVLLLEQARLVSQEIYDERIQRIRPVAGDILYSREGERFGMAALVPEGINLCLGQRMMMFRTSDQFHSGYLMWALNSDALYQQAVSDIGGATSPHVSISDVINFTIPMPPPQEQNAIYGIVRANVSRIDVLVAETQSAITLLQERRAALISAVVTGKIDVRGLVDQQELEAV